MYQIILDEKHKQAAFDDRNSIICNIFDLFKQLFLPNHSIKPDNGVSCLSAEKKNDEIH